MDKNVFVASSTEFLYDGMIVPHDIFNLSHTVLLIAQGAVLNESIIERIKRINNGETTILVTVETREVMLRQGISDDLVTSIALLEEHTGYSEIKLETVEILENIVMAGSTVIPQKDLSHISNALSKTVDSTAPSTILNLINALAPADEYLQRHCLNVSLLNGLFGKWLGLPTEVVDMLVLVGLLHDCGKAMMPHKILSAPRPLTVIEFEVIKNHPAFSHNLLGEFPPEVQLCARGHHEKMNGFGYPDGLSGEDIPYISRVTAISDIYDAMSARRSYKNANSPFSALANIKSLGGTSLDAQLVDIFVENLPKELVGKPVKLSNGSVGIIDSVDWQDIEFPRVKIRDRVIKTHNELHCTSMYFSEDEMLDVPGSPEQQML